MIHRMARGNVKHCGLFSKLRIKGAATFLTFTIKEMKYLKNCMSSAWNKAMGTATKLLSGKRFNITVPYKIISAWGHNSYC